MTDSGGELVLPLSGGDGAWGNGRLLAKVDRFLAVDRAVPGEDAGVEDELANLEGGAGEGAVLCLESVHCRGKRFS